MIPERPPPHIAIVVFAWVSFSLGASGIGWGIIECLRWAIWGTW